MNAMEAKQQHITRAANIRRERQSMNDRHQWPSISYEKIPWDRNYDELLFIPKSRRRKITSSYEAAIPLEIAHRTVTLPVDLIEELGEVAAELARFDAKQEARGYKLPALLLRSESAASSQIENLTSSVRNVAAAEISPDAPRNAQIIAGNVAAMRKALATQGTLTAACIQAIHKELMGLTNEERAGQLRSEQVWIGGTHYSPHGARFVPPTAQRVPSCLGDLSSFTLRNDVNPIAQAAIAHAQFETIHPFVDGNGRTGRALIHKQISDSGILKHATIPVSAGLLHNINDYLQALDDYHAGDYERITRELLRALETALQIGSLAAVQIDEVIERWKSSLPQRRGSAILRLPELLVEQPVINAEFTAKALGITDRAARNLLEQACEYGIVEQSGNSRRGKRYQATELIDILEEMTSSPGIRRLLSQS